MKRFIGSRVVSLYIPLQFLCGLAMAADYTDTTVPGTWGHAVNGPSGPVPQSVDYSDNVTIQVADLVGRTNTNAAISVTGSYRLPVGSGRGGGYLSGHYELTVATATLSVVNPDGTMSPASVTMSNMPVSGVHGVSIDHWVASGPVPVGIYVLSVAGQSICTLNRPACAPNSAYYVTVTETSDPLPVTYWWTSGLSDLASNPPFNLQLVPVNIATYPSDNSGPQQVCDLYDAQWQTSLQAFYDGNMGAGVIQIDSVTSTPVPNSTSSGSCSYTVYFQDLVDNPGVEQTFALPDGTVSYAGGPQPFPFPPEE